VISKENEPWSRTVVMVTVVGACRPEIPSRGKRLRVESLRLGMEYAP